jgi:hypothetical protein
VAAPEEVKVEVIHGLAAVFAGVDYYAITFDQAFFASNCGGSLEKISEQVTVLGDGVVERGEMFAGNDEDMDGRHRMNVREGVTELVLVDGGGGNGTFGDFAEKTGHGVTSRRVSVYNRAVEHGRGSAILLEKFRPKQDYEDFGRDEQ